MNAARPKLTRRRGACKECRQKKIRCDGANPCNHCQRKEYLCEYNIRRSRGHLRENSIQSLCINVATVTPPYATDSTMPVPSNSERSSVIFSAQDAEGTPNPLNTPFSEVSFSQLVSDSAHSYMDFDLSHEAITNSNQAEITDQQTSSFQNQMLYFSPSADMLMLDWLSPTCDQTLSKNGAAKFYDFVGIEHDGCANKCTISLFSERIVPDTTTAKTKPSSAHQTHRITALFQNVDGGSRRQQTVLEKVKVLLSSEHETCLSNFLRKVDSGGEHSSLVLTELPVTKLLQNAFKELGGLGLFINEEDVTRIQQRFFDSEHLPMDASDASLLVVSLAWGALLEPEMSSSSRVALLDAVLETSTLLLRQHHSVRKFLALVAVVREDPIVHGEAFG
ncbi:hypothetical protein PTT_08292 [Pyrenophora teres f. teres 0-1]|uniref:Zn(2)-C6 fungal-type domain-containing protein n=1 Tax=Pyrenophora teres f. teres (strain 0-1) TaxID=861557 RepID=E3RJG8_PYRTT|nr:hypothetical protein PTT_08292 [Pyrenophora teres f. teres 0-1]